MPRGILWLGICPGTMVKFYAIHDAIDAGMRAYDLLDGDEPYKDMFKPDTVTYRRYLVTAPTIRARIWTMAWWGGRRLVHSLRARRLSIRGRGKPPSAIAAILT
jgi:CelD/BcsL family acetyltransferase involved in cellulose biosynthesis